MCWSCCKPESESTSASDSDTGTKELKSCTQCKLAKYCDKECQKCDWKVHKLLHKELERTRHVLASTWSRVLFWWISPFVLASVLNFHIRSVLQILWIFYHVYLLYYFYIIERPMTISIFYNTYILWNRIDLDIFLHIINAQCGVCRYYSLGIYSNISCPQ